MAAASYEGQIYSATYSGVPVYELRLGSESVMRRRLDGYINATHILKVAGLDKPARTRILEREVQKGIHQKVQGGYGKYQGTWIPLDIGRELARRTRILDRLLPIFDFDVSGASPPPVPKSSTSKAKALRSLTGPAAPSSGRRRNVAATAASTASSKRTTSAPTAAAATADVLTANAHDPYAAAATATATAHGIPAGYVPASGRPRRMGGYVDDVGDMTASTTTATTTPVRSRVGMDIEAGADEIDDEDMEIETQGIRGAIGGAGGRERGGVEEEGRGVEEEDDEDDEDDEFELDYKVKYSSSSRRDAGKGVKRKRNAKVEHPRRAHRHALQTTPQQQQQQQQDLQNDPYYAVQTTLGAQYHEDTIHQQQQQEQQQEEARQQAIEAVAAANAELDERDRAHIVYSRQILDYFMLENDSAHATLSAPVPPPNFEVDRPIDDKGNTALHWACAVGDLSTAEDLIRRGASVGVRTHMDETPLVRAVLFTNNFEKHTMPRLIDLLWSTLTLRDWYGATVFNHLAATTQSKNKWRSARYYAYVLLEKMRRILSPAEIRQVLSSVDFDGDTAALKAARNGCTRLARMLLSYGPEAWDVPNKNGECAREVIERAARRKEERERERERSGGSGAAAASAMGYPLPMAGNLMVPAAPASQSSQVQHQRIDPQLSAAAVEAVNNVNAHAHAQAQAEAETEAEAEAEAEARERARDVYFPAAAGGTPEHHTAYHHHHHSRPPLEEEEGDETTTAPSGPLEPAEEVLAQIAPILHDAYRKLTAAFEPPIPSERPPSAIAASGAADESGGIDISDPRSLFNHLEADRASIRKQLAALREEEARSQSQGQGQGQREVEGEEEGARGSAGKSLEEVEEEYERIRAAYEDLVERAQEVDIKREIEKGKEKEKKEEEDGAVGEGYVEMRDVEKEKEEDAGEGEGDVVKTYKLLQLLVQVMSTRRQKVQELIDGCADAGCVSSTTTTTATLAREGDDSTTPTASAPRTDPHQQQQPIEPVNPNLRRLVALATGLKESELDEMAGEIEATLTFEKSGSVADIDGVAGGRSGVGMSEYLGERIATEKERQIHSQGLGQRKGSTGSGGSGGRENRDEGAGKDGDDAGEVIITESQKTVEMDIDSPQMDVDPAMEQQEQQASNARGVELMN